MRDAGNVSKPYDLEAMKKALLQNQTKSFGLFGGEALLMPIEDLEEIFGWALQQGFTVSVQTNGTLITERHIELFRKYKVGVGISLDGPDELNDSRWAGSLKETREATARSQWALRRLIEESQKQPRPGQNRLSPPSLIVTLHRGNASPERLPRLLDWLLELDALGLRYLNVHALETDHPLVAARLRLSDEEELQAMKAIAGLLPRFRNIRHVLPFSDIVAMLRGKDRSENVICIWNACDPWTTPAVQGVEGNGERSNCGRTNKEGIDWYKCDTHGHERQLALYQTPQEWGGCKGCRFFYACKGECPGTGIHGDWRNRTDHCTLWYGLYEHFEHLLLQIGERPVSLDPILPDLERALMAAWSTGRSATVEDTLRWLRGGCQGPQPTYDVDSRHGDHWDAQGRPIQGHGDRPHIDEHGDSGHGDEHGDSWGTVRGHQILGVAPVGKEALGSGAA